MLASICRRRLLRLRQIPFAAGVNRSQPNPSDALLSHSCSSAALAGVPVSEPCPTTTSYLISCGLSPAAASAYSCKHRIHSTAKADAVRALLRSYGFTDADITEVARRKASILTLDPDRILRSKLDLFASLRISPRRLATAPDLLTRSLDKQLLPCIQFLRGIIGVDSAVGSVISRNPRSLMVALDKNMRPAVDALRRLGLPDKSISKLLTVDITVLTISVDNITQIFDDLKMLGLGVTDTGFVYGISRFCKLSRETRLRKLALYRSFGVSEGTLQKALKRCSILHLSDESIKKKLRFFLDDLKFELSEVLERGRLIEHSLEKTIKPRCAVISVLMRERKIDPNIKLPSALVCSAKVFSKRYVLRHAQDAPDVVKAYEGKIAFEGFRDQDVLVPPKP